MKKPSDTLLVSRMVINRTLHLAKNRSYEILPRSLFAGKVTMADVRAMMARSARNGAKWDGGEVYDAEELIGGGIPRRALFRLLRTAPHFRISRKVALVNKSEILKSILKGEQP